MAGGDVRNLMGHHRSQFGLILCSQYQTRIYIQVSAWKSECIYLLTVNYFDGERDPGIRVSHQPLTELLNVVVDDRIVEQARVSLNGFRHSSSHRLLLLDGVHVEALIHPAFANAR